MKLIIIFVSFFTFIFSQSEPCVIPSGFHSVQRDTFDSYSNYSETCGLDGSSDYTCRSDSYSVMSYVKTGDCVDGYDKYTLNIYYYDYVEDSTVDCGNDATENNNQCICNNSNLTYNTVDKTCSCPSGQHENSQGICTDDTPALDCGNDAAANNNQCFCNNPNLTYNTADKTCSCPSGQQVDSDGICIDTCVALTAPWLSSNINQNECNTNTLQTLYNNNSSNNNNPANITNSTFHCNNICYFQIQAIENNNTQPEEPNINPDPDSNDNYDFNETTGNSADIVHAIRHFEGLNDRNLQMIQGQLSNLKYSVNDLDSDLNTFATSNIDELKKINQTLETTQNENGNKIDEMKNELSDKLSTLDNSVASVPLMMDKINSDLNKDLINKLDEISEKLDNNSTNTGTTNNTINMDDTRIVNSIEKNTQKLNEIKEMNQDEITADTSFLDSYQSYYDDLTSSVQDVENNVNDLMATIQGNYTPQFQTHNTCVINFPTFKKSTPVNMCKFSPVLRPFVTFIFTIIMLVLLIRLHFYLFPKVFKSD